MKKIIKILIVILVVSYLITGLMVFIKFDFFKNNKSPLNEVYNNMRNINNVKIKRVISANLEKRDKELKTDKNSFEFTYNYDVVKKWGDGKYTFLKLLGDSETSGEEKISFVNDEGLYHYCLNSKCSNLGKRNIYLDDYYYILEILKNTTSVTKNSDGTYKLNVSEETLHDYVLYLGWLRGTYSFLERDTTYPYLNLYNKSIKPQAIKVAVKITDDNYLSEIKIDIPSEYDFDYSITYSDYNNANVEIPISVLATLSGDN
ncbi:MAG: hypothetical protein IJI22_04640 [Bacilli bacterium]|nr:hypothetical protein [Bacilli bacterium]